MHTEQARTRSEWSHNRWRSLAVLAPASDLSIVALLTVALKIHTMMLY